MEASACSSHVARGAKADPWRGSAHAVGFTRLMRVNSSALLARKMIVTRRFGADAWNQIFKRLARIHPCLRSPLTASSQVPLPEFLAFNEELVDRLYGGDA